MKEDPLYKNRKVITIGIVSELTGLSERQIRYYEERKLIYPERTEKGNRKYSFADVERLIEIAEMREEGVQTTEIRRDFEKENKGDVRNVRQQMLKGQLNARFGMKRG